MPILGAGVHDMKRQHLMVIGGMLYLGMAALSSMLVGCSDVPPRSAVIAEQRRIESAVKVGASAQETRDALVSLGYSCRDTQGATTDCAKAVQDKTELHVCLARTESRVKDISYGLRPCGS
jgi:hypothetical protein